MIVCEAEADRAMGAAVVRRQLGAAGRPATGVEARLGGTSAGETYLRWASVQDLARAASVKSHGHFSGEPAEPDAQAARLALLLIRKKRPEATGAILLRDADGDAARHRGLVQARDQSGTSWRFPIAVGVASPCREAWAIGALPASDARDVAGATKACEFNPLDVPHKLAHFEREKRPTAKAMLDRLAPGTDGAAQAGWVEALSDSELQRRNANTGLPEFVAELSERIVPLFA